MLSQFLLEMAFPCAWDVPEADPRLSPLREVASRDELRHPFRKKTTYKCSRPADMLRRQLWRRAGTPRGQVSRETDFWWPWILKEEL